MPWLLGKVPFETMAPTWLVAALVRRKAPLPTASGVVMPEFVIVLHAGTLLYLLLLVATVVELLVLLPAVRQAVPSGCQSIPLPLPGESLTAPCVKSSEMFRPNASECTAT